MTKQLVLATAVIVAGVPRESSFGASFTISDWFFGIGIDGPGSSSDGSATFTELFNPFAAEHVAGPAASTVWASYNCHWDDNFGSFEIQTSQVAEGVPPGGSLFTVSEGWIRITPSIDLSLTIDAAWNYNLQRDFMQTRMEILAYALNPWTPLYGDQQIVSTLPWQQPVTGTLTSGGEVSLPAGRTSVLAYTFRIDTFGGTLGYFGTGDGYVNFTVQAVPEPATALFCTLAAWPFLRRSPLGPESSRRLRRPFHPSSFILSP